MVQDFSSNKFTVDKAEERDTVEAPTPSETSKSNTKHRARIKERKLNEIQLERWNIRLSPSGLVLFVAVMRLLSA